MTDWNRLSSSVSNAPFMLRATVPALLVFDVPLSKPMGLRPCPRRLSPNSAPDPRERPFGNTSNPRSNPDRYPTRGRPEFLGVTVIDENLANFDAVVLGHDGPLVHIGP